MGLDLGNGDFVFWQSSRTNGPISSKEPDFWFGPNNINVNGGSNGFPTLVLEVGALESTPQLHNDAHWWYANSRFSQVSSIIDPVLIYTNFKSYEQLHQD